MSTNQRLQRSVGDLRRVEADARLASTSPLMENLMRLGYVVRGLVYFVMGLLALQVAVGGGGTLADTQGAIAAVGAQPFGGFLLVVVLVGLIGYALWGFIRAIFDPLHKGSDAKGLIARAGYIVSGVSYALLALATYRLITGGAAAARNGAQAAQTQASTASILSNSWGPIAVALVAAILIAGGAAQIVQGVRDDFDKMYSPYNLSSSQRIWIERLGRFGTAARGLVFALVGVFLFLAAYKHNPQEATGIDGALAALLHQPFGPWLLGIVALGLVAFGIFSALSGIWLRIKR